MFHQSTKLKLNNIFGDENAQAKVTGANNPKQLLDLSQPLKQPQQLHQKTLANLKLQQLDLPDKVEPKPLRKNSLIPRLRPLAIVNQNIVNLNNGALKKSSIVNKNSGNSKEQQQDGAGKIFDEDNIIKEKLRTLLAAEPKNKLVDEIEDIDKSTNRDAVFLVCDIAQDIYEYMFTLEEEQAVKFDYLKGQKIFTPKVRQRLVNWCMETHNHLKLLPETLYMTIAVIDRFFDRVPVKHQSQVQLVAVGALLIASKYEEIYPPEVSDLIHLTLNAYSRREIMRVEIYILEQLEFNLGKPIPLAFLRRFSKAAHCDTKMHSMAKYLMELSLSEYECSHWKPSLLAAAALYTTIHLVCHDPSPSAFRSSSCFPASLTRRTSPAASDQQQPERWTKSLVHYTSYTSEDLLEPAAKLCKILKRSQKSPQSFYTAKKNVPNLMKWPEFKSNRVDELIRLGEQPQE